MQPPFRLLAITPPSGAVEAALVAQWRDAAGDVAVGLLLREVDAPESAVSPSGRLAALAQAARAQGMAVLWSVDAATVVRIGLPPHVDGVQLRGDPDGTMLAAVRARIGSAALLGRSVHGAPSAAAVVDYSVFAPVFLPRTTSTGIAKKPAGVAALRAWTELVPRVFALGGVEAGTAAACVRAGAFGLASIRSFFGPGAGVTDNVRTLAQSLTAPSG